ncbi:MAG: ATP synthase F0 subunit C [Deltaproteobacteria bacterium]|nr:ATP synthase F0 subunit C [Deltaproteobacteria bacterium]
MKKSLRYVVLSMLFVLVSAPFVFAANEAAQAAPVAGATVDYTKAIVASIFALAAGLAIGLGAIGAGLGLGQATSGASNAVGRNPEAQGKVMLTMMVGMAMTESVAIYALVISLVILFANPLLKIIG